MEVDKHYKLGYLFIFCLFKIQLWRESWLNLIRASTSAGAPSRPREGAETAAQRWQVVPARNRTCAPGLEEGRVAAVGAWPGCAHPTHWPGEAALSGARRGVGGRTCQTWTPTFSLFQ